MRPTRVCPSVRPSVRPCVCPLAFKRNHWKGRFQLTRRILLLAVFFCSLAWRASRWSVSGIVCLTRLVTNLIICRVSRCPWCLYFNEIQILALSLFELNPHIMVLQNEVLYLNRKDRKTEVGKEREKKEIEGWVKKTRFRRKLDEKWKFKLAFVLKMTFKISWGKKIKKGKEKRFQEKLRNGKMRKRTGD